MSAPQHLAVVDDDPEARSMVADYLSLHGFRVTPCDGGSSFRALLQSDPPDLAILDLNMPGEDGLSLIRFLKQTTGTPVLMLTASASAIDRVVGLELGADDYVAKPCELRELLARVRSVLRRVRWLRPGQMERRLAAIASVDVVGFSRLVQHNEPDALAAIDRAIGSLAMPLLSEHHGTLFKILGDGALAEFQSVVDAVNWAVAFQETAATSDIAASPALPTGGRLTFRLGIAVGDIVVNQHDRLGEGVALAVRVQEVARPGGVAVSDYVHQLVKGKVTARFVDAGVQPLKNIEEPMRIFHWEPRGEDLA
jgi:class 3 adenylate cyclase